MKRRDFLKQGMTVSAGLALAGIPKLARLQALKKPQSGVPTRSSLRIEVNDPVGAVRAWVPVPLLNSTDYFKRQGDTWTGNYKAARSVQYDKYGTGLVFAEWSAGEKAPVLEVTSRL